MSKWSGAFWRDLLERVGSTFVYALIAVLTAQGTDLLNVDPQVWWTLVGLPTALSALKGIAANFAVPASGGSLLSGNTVQVNPAPPAGD